MRRRRTLNLQGCRPDGTRIGEFAVRARKRRERAAKRPPGYVNRGWFRNGDDPRRHTFTTEECSLGYRCAQDSLLYNYPRIGRQGSVVARRRAGSILRHHIFRKG